MPYQSTLPDTLFVGGTDLQTLAGVWLDDLAFLFAPGLRRGSNDAIPGRRGQLGAGKPYDAYPFTVPLSITPHDAAGVEGTTKADQRWLLIQNLQALAAVVAGSNGLVTLKRRLTNSGGTYDEHTAAGEFLTGLMPTEASTPERADFELQFLNLDGAWTPDSGSTWLVP